MHILLLILIAAPVIEPQSIDRGTVRVGPPLVQEFALTNRGTAPLTITDVRSSCGCLAPKIDKKELQPGSSATLRVEVNTLSQPAGPIAWTTTVHYRSGEQTGEVALVLRANLIKEIQVEPASIAFTIRQPRSVEVSVVDTRSKPFTITGVGSSLPHVKAEFTDATRRRIRLTAAPTATSGTQFGTAWFTTDDPLYPEVRLPMQVTVVGPERVKAAPSVVDISRGGTIRVMLRATDGSPVIVERIEANAPITVESISGNIVTLVFRCAKTEAPSDQSVSVFLKQPAGEKVNIPVIVR